MSMPGKSLVYFGVYLLVLGAALVLIPNLLLALFAVAPTREVYIRILGVVLLVVAYYYIRSAQMDFRPFFAWTVQGRVLVVVALVAYVALGLAPASLLLFPLIDAAGASWTWLTLRSSR